MATPTIADHERRRATADEPERQPDAIREREHHVRGEGVREAVGEVEAAGDAQDQGEADAEQAVGGAADDPVDGELLDRDPVLRQ